MKKAVLLIFILVGFCLSFTFAQTITISTLHQNNTLGVPLLLNQTVTIRGEVTATDQFGITAAIEDTTGGVSIYDANFVSKVDIGDIVTISGLVTQYSGLTELKNVSILERIIKSPSIEPSVITCQDIATDGVDGIEKFESELVRINNVSVNTAGWNVTGSGANYVLTDSTGSCDIRIDADTDIANTLAPPGRFDVVGIVAQYDISSPYTQGYQLMPRYKKDIISSSNITISQGPEEKNITAYSMDINWVTEDPSNSIIMYGKTTSYEIDTIFVDESVYNHSRQLAGLSPATVYHVRVGSGQGQKLAFSFDHVVITASDPSSTGEMRVYFSQSVDNSYATFKPASKVNILSKFIQRVNSAKYSIDACFYSITMEEVAQVLIGAYSRGVKVRVIFDSDNETTVTQMIRDAGIPIINDKFGSNTGDAAMHNKFMVIDHRDGSSATDDWVWTGSYNLSFSATFENAENVIEIQDQSLAACYTMEFNEMWGSDTDTPDLSKSRFSYRKTNNTPHVFNINGIEVRQYMSPSDQGVNHIVDEIQKSQSSLYFCMLIFQTSSNPSKIADAMKSRWLSIPNFKVKGIFDEEENFNNSISQYFNMIGTGSKPWNPPADVYLDKENNGTLHHKYLIIDGNGGSGQPLLITGSYNWSNAAETFNDENFLIIKDSTIANLYLQEFAARYHKAGGTEDLILTSIETDQDRFLPTTIQLSQNYPNPFNSSTVIEYQLIGNSQQKVELAIYNLLGQKIKTLVNQQQTGGFYTVFWDGKNEDGELVSSGIYVYQLGVDDVKMEKKLILLQ